MEKQLLLLVFLLCFGKNFGQEIEGEILNSATSEGIANAEISADSGILVVSDIDGHFQFTAENFPLKLHISALGFQDQSFLLKEFRTKIQVYLDPSEESLSEVIVRSTLVPNSLRKTPAAVNLISEEDFRKSGPASLMEVFTLVPGMYVNRGALNTNKINIRGIGARSQYSTNRIQSYFDGIPLTTAEGELDLGDIDKESLDRIEVIKGPVSSIYGAGLGGSINLFSAEPKAEGSKVEIASDFGSFNMNKNSAKASYNAENASVFANYSHLKTAGYRENGNYDRKSMLLNAKLKSSENDRLSFLANFTKLKAFIPSSLNEEDFNNDPQSAAYTWAAAKGYESYERGLLGISYKHQFSQNFSNESSVFMNFRNGYEPRPFNILKENRTAAGARTKFGLKLGIFDLPSELSFGAEYFREWYEGSTFENLYEENNGQGSLRGQRLSSNQQNRNYSNFFAQ
ncbi:MAG: TonB-dependent receptor plug domain-containing protein, partial [Salegentibacter sp.]